MNGKGTSRSKSKSKTKAKNKVQVKKPPVLFDRTQKLIQDIQAKLDGARLLVYWTSSSGSVCANDVVALYDVLSTIGRHERTVLFIKSSGGSGQSSYRMINLLRQYTDHLTAVVPLSCASAATMMALGADEIRMGPMAYLTAVDTSLRHDLSPVDIDNDLVRVSQDELTRVIRMWKESANGEDKNPYSALFEHVHPLVIGAVDRASSLSVKLCTSILRYHMDDVDRAQEISLHLNSAYPSHSYPITLDEAQSIGLKAKPLDLEVNDMLLDLNEVYAEMGQRALTDYDESNYHAHEILNIHEGGGIQIYFQQDKDWHYRSAERRWVPMHDQSTWKRMVKQGKKTQSSVFHIR